ncbi:MAG: amidase family protein, partial [Acidimicrobiia bacterium]
PALARDHARDLALRRIAAGLWDDVDAVLVPTAPTHPTFAEVAAAPVALNAALGRFTNGCNVLGWCAAAVPLAPRADGVPFGVTLLGPAWHDRPVWAAAARLAGMAEPVPGPPTGAVPGPGAAARQGENGGGPTDGDGPVEGIRLAVCGAHLDGQPLNHQLRSRGARLLARTTTAPAYRMVRLDTDPPKPGVVRVAEGGGPLEVEVWALPAAAFGTFVDEAPPPLAIGTVELADGTAVNGFLCEPHALAGAEDITHHGGWRAWLASRA